MNTEKLWSYLKSNKNEIENNGIKLTFSDINWGDRYYNETGEECEFEIFGDTYIVGYVYITEDSDDWAQGECYQCYICRKGNCHFSSSELSKLLEDFKLENRNRKIEDIL